MLRGHRDLRAFQLSYKLAMEIFHLSRAFPQEESTHLQIRFAVLRVVSPQIWLRDLESDVIRICW